MAINISLLGSEVSNVSNGYKHLAPREQRMLTLSTTSLRRSEMFIALITNSMSLQKMDMSALSED
jgi:hypothetical protein